jgi:enolase-phosphatase E1
MMKAILLDIEGTTTPVAFVYDVLFPYAWRRIATYLERHWTDREVLDIRARFSLEQTKEDPSPGFDIATLAGTAGFAAWLMERDRKSPGLKYLQGLIWNEGYRDGALKGDVFPDVAPAIERWHRAGITVAIYSAGSALAQKLLFASTAAGDLTPMLSGYFDTSVGAKTDPASYARIAEALTLAPSDILFVSDTPAELAAARAAGCEVALSLRPGNAPVDSGDGTGALGDVRRIHSFDELP